MEISGGSLGHGLTVAVGMALGLQLAQIDSDRLALTLENHTVVGGLFETVASEALQRGVRRQVTPISLPDEFLAAGALPTLHDRYGLSTARTVASVLDRL
jgi:transketolase